MKRLDQIILIGTFVGFSWLAMQAVHELGHVIGGLVGGGIIEKVVLYPNTISCTYVSPNPHPLLEVWAGPGIGTMLPLLVFAVAAVWRIPGLYLLRFFAGFCLITNGVYIGGGSFQGLADAGVMLMYGSRQWQLLVFGILTVPLRLYLWNGLGEAFGLGSAKGKVNRTAAITSLVMFITIVAIEMLIGSR